MVVGSEVRATVGTECGGEEVAAHETVVGTSEPRECVLRLTDAIGGVGNLLGGAGNLAVANHVEHLEETECLILCVLRRITCANHAAAVGL